MVKYYSPEQGPEEFDEMDMEMEDESRERNNGKAPLPYRLAVWGAVVVLFFAVGYWGTNIVLSMFDREKIPGQENVVTSPGEAGGVVADPDAGVAGENARQARFGVYVPSENSLQERQVTLTPGIMEDDIRDVLTHLFNTMKKEGVIDRQVKLLHVFRNGEVLYIDVNDPFLDALGAVSTARAQLVMTAIVKTVASNFSPVTRIRIIVNGKESEMKKPVDLTASWKLPSE
ncbi:MAG: GerMN domain-containing protein [Synergistota bacterium]|nr:GerMN domain-containing protein [Synergistota bacterium]